MVGSFFTRGLARVLDAGVDEADVTIATGGGGGLCMGGINGTSVFCSWLRSSPDTLGWQGVCDSGLSFKRVPRHNEKKHSCYSTDTVHTLQEAIGNV